jgi:hypothetical protein
VAKPDKKKPIQNPEYEKDGMTRRRLVRRVATVCGLGSAAAYLSWAPSNWPLSMRDPTGRLSEPKVTPLRLNDYRVEKPMGATDVAVGRGPSPEERLRKALDAVGGLHALHPARRHRVGQAQRGVRPLPNLGATSNPEMIGPLDTDDPGRLPGPRRCGWRTTPSSRPADCFAKSGVGAPRTQAGDGCISPTQRLPHPQYAQEPRSSSSGPS